MDAMAATTRAPASIHRRRILQGLLWVLIAPLAAAWVLLARRRQRAQAQPLRLAKPETAGVSFHGSVILVHDEKQTVALSARCPHLGCLVNRVDGERLICPCHGSRFHLDGRVMRGPAQAGLTRLAIESEQKDGTLIVRFD